MNEEIEEFENEDNEITELGKVLDISGIKLMSYFVMDHEKRLKDIESKIYPKRMQIKRPLKMAILYNLGIVDLIHNLYPNTPKNEKVNKKAELLSLLIGEDVRNIKGDLSNESDLRKQPIYKPMVDFFERLDLKDKAEEADKILVQIQTEDEKKATLKKNRK